MKKVSLNELAPFYISIIFSGYVFLLLTMPLFAQNYLDGPECVSFDSLNNRYLVSSFNNGRIVEIDMNGTQTIFKEGLGHCYGNCIHGNRLYVSTGTAVLGFELSTADTVMNLSIPTAIQMDGMAVDSSENLYVVDMNRRWIYKIDLIDQSYSIFINSGLPPLPQDLLYEKDKHRLLLCAYTTNSPVLAINLADKTIDTLVVNPVGKFDGIACDNQKNYYLSSWATNSVYRYDSTFTNPATLISSGHNSPSNICCNRRDNVLAVPNFDSDNVEFIPISTNTIDVPSPNTPRKFKLYQNYPNPFNPTTTIKYDLPEKTRVVLKIYNALGQEVRTLLYEFQTPGLKSVVWNGTDNAGNSVSSGVYIYRIQTDDSAIGIQSKKMLLLK